MLSEALPLLFLVLTPGLGVLLLGVSWLCGYEWPERALLGWSRNVTRVMLGAGLWLGASLITKPEMTTPLWPWFTAGHYQFALGLKADAVSGPLLVISTLLLWVTARFSSRYLHGESGQLRFYFGLQLFAFSSMLVLAAASLDLLLAGWELVGVASILLIGFFSQRATPARNALRVFAYYRFTGFCLLLAIFFVHSSLRTSQLTALNQHSHQLGWPGLVAGLLLCAAAGKSALPPFSSWLPLAMEGPTPSSAIFYGGIAVHLGAYLMLRSAPLIEEAVVVQWLMLAVAAAGALIGTLLHRAAADVKSSIAWATVTQISLIFLEIALGFTTLALFHMMGHMCLRTIQFLRAPSVLHEANTRARLLGAAMPERGSHWARIFPDRVKLALYRAAIAQGYFDRVIEGLFLKPLLGMAVFCGAFEFEPKPQKPEPEAVRGNSLFQQGEF
jgi:NAD(P)H-quinone oxidoreductase subunit 5